MEVLRGEIYWVELKSAYEGASIQIGLHPVVIVSNDLNNKYCSNVDVLPITSKFEQIDKPFHARINDGCGLIKKSMAQAEQECKIPKNLLKSKIGDCDEESIIRINKAIKIQKGLYEPFDINKIQRLVRAIIESNKDDFNIYDNKQIIKSTLICEFKWYCESYGYDYKQIYNKYKKVLIKKWSTPNNVTYIGDMIACN